MGVGKSCITRKNRIGQDRKRKCATNLARLCQDLFLSSPFSAIGGSQHWRKRAGYLGLLAPSVKCPNSPLAYD